MTMRIQSADPYDALSNGRPFREVLAVAAALAERDEVWDDAVSSVSPTVMAPTTTVRAPEAETMAPLRVAA